MTGHSAITDVLHEIGPIIIIYLLQNDASLVIYLCRQCIVTGRTVICSVVKARHKLRCIVLSSRFASTKPQILSQRPGFSCMSRPVFCFVFFLLLIWPFSMRSLTFPISRVPLPGLDAPLHRYALSEWHLSGLDLLQLTSEDLERLGKRLTVLKHF